MQKVHRIAAQGGSGPGPAEPGLIRSRDDWGAGQVGPRPVMHWQWRLRRQGVGAWRRLRVPAARPLAQSRPEPAAAAPLRVFAGARSVLRASGNFVLVLVRMLFRRSLRGPLGPCGAAWLVCTMGSDSESRAPSRPGWAPALQVSLSSSSCSESKPEQCAGEDRVRAAGFVAGAAGCEPRY